MPTMPLTWPLTRNMTLSKTGTTPKTLLLPETTTDSRTKNLTLTVTVTP